MDVTGVYTEVLIRWLDAIEANKPPLIFAMAPINGFRVRRGCSPGETCWQHRVVQRRSLQCCTGVQTSLNELCGLLLRLSGSSRHPSIGEAS